MENIKPTSKDINEFFKAYLEALLWSSQDHDSGESLDRNYQLSDIDEQAKTKLLKDCVNFISKAYSKIKDNMAHAGHDFCLTRNEHGAGFQDGHWGKDEKFLFDLAKTFTPVELYVTTNSDSNKKYLVMAEGYSTKKVISILAEEVQQSKYKEIYQKLENIVRNRYTLHKAADWEKALENGMIAQKIGKLIREDPELGMAAAKHIGRKYYNIAKNFLKGLSTVADIEAELKANRERHSSSLSEAMFWILRGVIYAIEDMTSNIDVKFE